MPTDLNEIIAEFAELDPRERLEMLLGLRRESAAAAVRVRRAASCRRAPHPQCQSPVFLWIKLIEGKIDFQAWVAPEAPTVKGFVGISATLFTISRQRVALNTPTDLLKQLGLNEALGMTRTRGCRRFCFICGSKWSGPRRSGLASSPRKSRAGSPCYLLPLDRCRRLAANVVKRRVNAFDLVDDPRADPGKHIVRQVTPVGRHKVFGLDGPNGQGIS